MLLAAPRPLNLLTAVAVAASFSLAAVAAAAAAAAKQDPCEAVIASNNWVQGATNTPRVVTGAEVVACYNSFPIDAEKRAAQVDAMKRFLQLYPYLDIAKASSAPNYESKVDIIALLDKAAADETLDTEFAFQTKLSAHLASLNDAHVSYFTRCFSSTLLMQPFMLSVKHGSNGAASTIYVRNTTLNSDTFSDDSVARILPTLQASQRNATKYVGWTVKSIDGKPAAEYLQRAADSLGQLKDPQGRFNMVLAQAAYLNGSHLINAGDWAVTSRILPSMANAVTYELEKSGSTATVKADWVGYSTAGTSFSTSDRYYQAMCSLPDSNGEDKNVASFFRNRLPLLNLLDKNRRQRLDRPIDVKKVLRNYNLHVSSINSRIQDGKTEPNGLGFITDETDLNDVTPLASDEASAFYMLNGTIGVWLSSSFDADTPYERMASTIIAGLQALEKAGAKQLIIDGTDNGGGYMCLAAMTIQLLFGSGGEMLQHDVRLSPTFAAILEKSASSDALVNASDAISLSNVIPVTPDADSALTHRHTFLRGGVQGSYSDRFNLYCGDFTDLPKLQRAWPASAVTLLNDGQCGSSCAMFVRTLRSRFGPSAFEGANVVGYHKIAVAVRDVVRLAKIDEDKWPLLPTVDFPLPVAAGQIPLWESYERFQTVDAGAGGAKKKVAASDDDALIPAEWDPAPADVHIRVADHADRLSVWRAVAAVISDRSK
ncbi:hypothetical protein DFJ73DRAFT_962120 [Zopfochytrium polystomum]|nr:hypothetical protein DFJ73DRAFT_962120 [Zopfochytrium polystomum]